MMMGVAVTALVTAWFDAFPCDADDTVVAGSSRCGDGCTVGAAATDDGAACNTRRSSTGAGGLSRRRSIVPRLARNACQPPDARGACEFAALGAGNGAARCGSLAVPGTPSVCAGAAAATLRVSVTEPAAAAWATLLAEGSDPMRCASSVPSTGATDGGTTSCEGARVRQSAFVEVGVVATRVRSCGSDERAIEFADAATGAMLAPCGRLDLATCAGEAGGRAPDP
jgi:hypothetical protein